MNLKSSSLLLVFMIVCGLNRSQAQEKITLEQAINLALTNNIQLKQAKLNVALTAEEYKQSKWALTPSLNANSGWIRAVDTFRFQAKWNQLMARKTRPSKNLACIQ